MLGERRSDPVEAALDAGLPDALLEARRVADRERRESGKGLEQARFELAELPIRVTRRDPEHAPALSRPGHGRRDRAREAFVRLVRDRLAEPVVDAS
jgi:hypothetical protein